MDSGKTRALTGFTLILMYIFGFLVFWFFNFQRVVVKGNSMLPTFQNGQVVWATKAYWLVGGVRDGDVVVVREPEQQDYIIKRVYKVAGETVDDELAPFDFRIVGNTGPFQVPEGHYYVLGDNLEVSQDSRTFGPIESKNVIGKFVPFNWAAIVIGVLPVLVLLVFSISSLVGRRSVVRSTA